jgi:hypothetical protein
MQFSPPLEVRWFKAGSLEDISAGAPPSTRCFCAAKVGRAGHTNTETALVHSCFFRTKSGVGPDLEFFEALDGLRILRAE